MRHTEIGGNDRDAKVKMKAYSNYKSNKTILRLGALKRCHVYAP